MEILLHHAQAVLAQNGGVGETTLQRLLQRCRVSSTSLGEMQRLGDGEHGAADDDLIGELGQLSAADWADPRQPAQNFHHRADPRDRIDGAAAEDGERAIACAPLAAGHRGVDVVDAERFQTVALREARLHRDGTHHRQDRAGPHIVRDRGCGEQHLVDDRGGAEHYDHHIGRCHSLGGAGGDAGAGGCCLLRRAVPRRDVEPGLHQATAHVAAHDARAKQANTQCVRQAWRLS